ncbi:hypothetical protein QAD02_009374 [Eretmocerus hayati]|uniref:Uncharacterized protein n=1 Tax=Eretmocerus hayati TaxID=131215 RepID=A0ACC2N9X5_9HYME|nr:hypothetical protein QAD02_009374 [Eretmocerus hayati]
MNKLPSRCVYIVYYKPDRTSKIHHQRHPAAQVHNSAEKASDITFDTRVNNAKQDSEPTRNLIKKQLTPHPKFKVAAGPLERPMIKSPRGLKQSTSTYHTQDPQTHMNNYPSALPHQPYSALYRVLVYLKVPL